MKISNKLEALQSINIGVVSTETTSMDGLFLASNNDITKRTLGSMALQSTGSYDTIVGNNSRYLQSVTISLPTIFNATTNTATSGNPNLVAVLASQTAKYVLAAPNASNGTPSFRQLLITDILNLASEIDAKQNVAGGAENYVLKKSTSNNIVASQIFDNGTNVGVGTITPNSSYKVDVNGGIIATTARFGTASLGVNILNSFGTAPRVASTSSLDFFATSVFTFYTSGESQRIKINTTGVKFGTGTPNYNVDIDGNLAYSGLLYLGNPTYGISFTNGIVGQFLKRSEFVSIYGTTVQSNTWDNIRSDDIVCAKDTEGLFAKSDGDKLIFSTIDSEISTKYWKLGGNIDLSGDGIFDIVSGYDEGFSGLTQRAPYNYLWNINGYNKMKLTPAGNLSVGGIDPEAVLHAHAIVEGSSEVVMLKATNNNTTSSYFSIAIDSTNNRTKFYAGGEVWATSISKFMFAAADVSGVWNFSVVPQATSDATTGNHLVRLSQVQALLSGGFAVSTSCKLAFNTNQSLTGSKTQGGYTTVTGDNILLTAQSTASQNGVYVFDGTNWARNTANDTDTEIRSKGHLITNGTYANIQFVNTNGSTITVGTTAITYQQWSGAETDPVWSAFKSANSITDATVTNWNAAFGWGNHASAGYQSAITSTTNYLLKKGASTIGNSQVFDNGTNVGVGTASPTSKLHINGGIDIGGIVKINGLTGSTNHVMTFDGTNTVWAGITVSKISDISTYYQSKITTSNNYVLKNTTGGVQVSQIFDNGASVGIGTSSPNANYKVDINGNINIVGKLYINGQTGNDHYFLKYNGATHEFAELNTGEMSDGHLIIKYAYDSVYTDQKIIPFYSDVENGVMEGYITSNQDSGVAIGVYGYQLQADNSTKEFGIELNKNDGNLYHRSLNGTTSYRILTELDSVEGSGNWNGGDVTNPINMKIANQIYFDKTSSNTWTAAIYSGVSNYGKSLYISSTDSIEILAGDTIKLNASTIEFGNVVFDTSDAALLVGYDAKFHITSLGGGLYRAKLVQL